MSDDTTPRTPSVNVELYIKLIDILQEFQLPGGKFDGHGLITALCDAKQARKLRRELAGRDEQVARLRELLSQAMARTAIKDCACATCKKWRADTSAALAPTGDERK